MTFALKHRGLLPTQNSLVFWQKISLVSAHKGKTREKPYGLSIEQVKRLEITEVAEVAKTNENLKIITVSASYTDLQKCHLSFVSHPVLPL